MKTRTMLLCVLLAAIPMASADGNTEEPDATTPIEPPSCNFIAIKLDPSDPIDWSDGCFDAWVYWATHPLDS